MSTKLAVKVNIVNGNVSFETTPANYIELELDEGSGIKDYLIWTEGDDQISDLMTHKPLTSELNNDATQIDPDSVKQVAKCFLMDDSGLGGYYTRLVKGMGLNQRYVFCFSFDGDTASEPQLEAWDDSDHDSYANHVLGNDTPANSMVKAICTTASLPGDSWGGTAIAGSGASRVVKLNPGVGAVILDSGDVSKELYANIKIVIPAGYETPAVETFVLTTRFTWS